MDFIDTEDIAAANINGIDYIFLADMGNNDGDRDNFAIYRFEEPKLGNE